MAHVIQFTPRSSNPSGLLRAARERSGLTDAQFAALLGRAVGRPELGPGTIRAWESGAISPPIQVVEAAQRLTPQVPAPTSVAQLDGSSPPDTGLLVTAPPALSTTPTSIEAVMQAFRDADRQVGGGYVYGAVVRYLEHEIAPRLFGGTSDVFSAAAALTEMAGWMAHDAGDDRLAGGHFERALRFASATTDVEWQHTSTPVIAISRNTLTGLGTRFGSPRRAEASSGEAPTIQPSPRVCTRWRRAHSPGCAAVPIAPGRS
jgi:transcriptional regulator with XRE-family HTH domain